MKHKVSDLEGALLDAAVAKAEGETLHELWTSCASIKLPSGGVSGYGPSSDWLRGGPIIERERIEWVYGLSAVDQTPRWTAVLCEQSGAWIWMPDEKRVAEMVGPTPLIAAMRAYVASKFGDEVELP